MRLARSVSAPDDRWIAVEGKLAPFGLSERRIDLERPLELGGRFLDAAKAIEYNRLLHRAQGRHSVSSGERPLIFAAEASVQPL
jgi:hypothetical protein